MRSASRSRARWSWAEPLALLAFFLGAGCSGSKLASRADGAAGAGGAGDGDGGAIGCALLGAAECAADPNCRPIEGEAIFDEESCVLPPYTVGCAPRACNGPTARAQDPYLREFLIVGGCLPYEWIPWAGSTTLAACTPCAALSTTQCKATPYCQVVEAQPVDELRSCTLAAQDVGCALGSLRCGGVTRASDPAGKVWSVPSSCVPPGWSADGGVSELPGCATPTGPEVCDSLSVRDCPLDESCRLLTGRPIDDQRSCALAPQPVGCVRADTTCDDALTRARDTHQGSWTFTNACLPPDWVNITGSSAPVSDCPSTDAGGV